MAEVTKRRARRVAEWLEQQRTERISRARPMRPQSGWFYGPYRGDPPEPEGGAGVREPLRPLPTAPAGTIELDVLHSEAPNGSTPYASTLDLGSRR